MKRSVTIAENSGFCFGVKRAADAIEKELSEKSNGEVIYTLGMLMHNDDYVSGLKKRGVGIISDEELEDAAKTACEQLPVKLFIRTHGITAQLENKLNELAGANKYFSYEDCTCPFVKRLHRIAEKHSNPADGTFADGKAESFFILIGDPEHPECRGAVSRFRGEAFVVPDENELAKLLLKPELVNLHKKIPVVAAQTTQKPSQWQKCKEFIKKLYTNAIFFDTICDVTQKRQSAAEALSRVSDAMIVIGGADSSNTKKLYDICRANCPSTLWIQNVGDIKGNELPIHRKTGIVAGASTPGYIIQEVFKTMSESEIKVESFEEMLESSIKTLNTGDTVTGYVTNVTDAELQLDIGTKVTGIIKADQISDDPGFKLTENFKVGDEIDAFVIRVSDIEGVAELSKKRIDSDRNKTKVLAAKETGEILEGKVIEVVKGGCVVSVGSVRVFVPASQTGVPKNGELNVLDKQNVKLKIIEVRDGKDGKGGRKIIGSIRAVLNEERREKESEFWANLKEGQYFTGKIKSMTSYGAFVDLGSGVDGMVHSTELSWKHIKSPAEVVSVGDEITVFVKSFDQEKKRISLGYKTEESNPWFIFTHNYAVGDVANVKIVNMMPFGAFAEIVDGVDGLIHISQIAKARIAQPSEVLTIGQTVDAKITEIDNEKQKVSLSIRALLEDGEEAEEAVEETVSEEAADEPVQE